jgi:hypothetical protein
MPGPTTGTDAEELKVERQKYCSRNGIVDVGRDWFEAQMYV